MAIICGPETAKIGFSQSTVCEKSIKITDIRKCDKNRIDVSIDGNLISVYKSGSAVRVDNEIWTVFLLSKQLTNNTANIRLTISEDPCVDKECHDDCIGNDLWSFVPVTKYDSKLIPTSCQCEKNEIITENSPDCESTGISTGAIIGIAILGITAAGAILYAYRRK